VSENVTPPSCSIGTPAYPESARSSGIQGTVIVKYVVTESGAITSVQVMRGPAELRAVSAAAVQNAHCTPARLDGAPVSVYRIARFPFRLKT
jgi:protein TonB